MKPEEIVRVSQSKYAGQVVDRACVIGGVKYIYEAARDTLVRWDIYSLRQAEARKARLRRDRESKRQQITLFDTEQRV
jgi:hypothetical protein